MHDIQEINISCDGLFDDLTAYFDQPIGAFGGKLSGGMRQKREEGKTILLVSHQEHIRELADREYTLIQNEIREKVIK